MFYIPIIVSFFSLIFASFFLREIGGLVSGFLIAVMMSNSGGAWDNILKPATWAEKIQKHIKPA